MGVQVELSENSQNLMKEFIASYGPEAVSPEHLVSPVEAVQLIRWLADEINIPETISKSNKEKIDFILASLRAELLKDLLAAMPGTNSYVKKMDPPASSSNQNKFILLAIAGTLLAACEGFDSIASLMSVLSFPSIAILAVGVVFSALSIVVFYGFDLVQVSQNLGVKLRDAPKLLDIYLSQMDEIKAIRRTIESYNLAQLTSQELETYELTISMLQTRLKAVAQASKQFEKALNSENMKVAETVVSWVAGLLFFGSGYFAGQSVAVFVLSLFMTAVTPAFFPIVLFGIGIGLAAFCLYWNVERVGVKKLISTWFGLDEENIEKLCDSENLANQERKLENLQKHVSSTKALITEVSELQQNRSSSALKETCKPEESSSAKEGKSPVIKTSNNIYSFHLNSSIQESDNTEMDYDKASGCSHN
ncbi:hypothetical protein [Legionella bononiensis]|uniref:Coiled-coil protein n=1 Tax=Legionella bononiensis TaxID=2793102 RepID=A0ABS1WG59_9GAMM|nr:hypothetical protein [Legionella bononiensis]MBL7481795.1 hypothetical protein [Legionella bononiensis]MBL7528344.1 hypothetical protein [Legionella bononiensis]MBL7564307.1 hypothetical protein [Legionella bononiensis]